jgi:hypothetical protein
MSMPRICKEAYVQSQDCLMHALYSGAAGPLLRELILRSLTNLGEDYPTPGVRAALQRFVPPRDASLGLLRAIFFVLLNQDSRMRTQLCAERVSPLLPELCPYKACKLYDALRETVIREWLKNETVGLLQLTESLKEAYLVS